MPLLDDKSLAEKAAKRAGYRVKTAGTKLNTEELAALEKHCRDLGKTPGELIRRLILTELGGSATDSTVSNPVLAEVLGVRLLLVNVLRPIAAGQKMTLDVFDKLLDEISTAKHELAGEIASKERK